MPEGIYMTEDQRAIRRKKRAIESAGKNGDIKTACRRFGIARSLEQHERYFYWKTVALHYMTRLSELDPKLLDDNEARESAEKLSQKKRGCVVCIEDRYFWAALHIVVIVGGCFLVMGALNNNPTGDISFP